MGAQVSCSAHGCGRTLDCKLECERRPTESSWCGSDAFYRDNFAGEGADRNEYEELGEDAEEEEEAPLVPCDDLVRATSSGSMGRQPSAGRQTSSGALRRGDSSVVHEQIALKSRKFETAGTYVASAYAVPLARRLSGRLDSFAAGSSTGSVGRRPASPAGAAARKEGDWLGQTFPEWQSENLPRPCEGAYWKKGTGCGLPVRTSAAASGKKGPAGTGTSTGHMYDCLTSDVIRSSKSLTDLVGGLIADLPPPTRACAWERHCGLPRVVCVNVMIPSHNPKNPWAKDEGGVSLVGLYEISPETSKLASSADPGPHVQLWRRFCDGPSGSPGGPKDDPKRSLAARRNHAKTQDRDSGLLKVTALCLNVDVLGIPQYFHQFNGASVTVTDSGYVVKDPEGEWIEVGIDVRKFSFLFRDAVYNFHGMLPKAQAHFGFSIQGSEEHELPERLLCDLLFSGLNLTEDAVQVPTRAAE